MEETTHASFYIIRSNKMLTAARKRLLRDFKSLSDDPPEGISGVPRNNNIMVWDAVICGPDETPFEGGTFRLTINFTEEYPNKPPKLRFVSKMFHPNVYIDGRIGLDILQNRWSPGYNVSGVLLSIQSLLSDPNPNAPANDLAAQLYRENRQKYKTIVEESVELSWSDSVPGEEEINGALLCQE